MVKKMSMVAVAALLSLVPVSVQAMEVESSYSIKLRKELVEQKEKLLAQVVEDDKRLMEVAKAAYNPRLDSSQKKINYEACVRGKASVDVVHERNISVLQVIKQRHDRQVGYDQERCEAFFAGGDPRANYMKDFSEEELKAAPAGELAELEEDFKKQLVKETAKRSILAVQLERNNDVHQNVVASFLQARGAAKAAWNQELATLYGMDAGQ